MKRAIGKMILVPWIGLIAISGLLWAYAPSALETTRSACAQHRGSLLGGHERCRSGAQTKTIASTEAGLFDGRNNRYSRDDIRALNQLLPMPDNNAALVEEIEKLQVQQRRFERQYGNHSIAALSARDRLELLHDQALNNTGYAQGDQVTTIREW